jgi:hypothetical protein
VSVPFSAPGFEPVQGASKKWAPLAANIAPISTLSAGDTVLQSAVTLLGRMPSSSPALPVLTSRAIAVVPTQ